MNRLDAQTERFDRLWSGSEAAVARLVRRVGPMDERDDALLETRLACWRSFHRFEGHADAFRSFACKIAHRQCFERWRRKPGGTRAPNAPTVEVLDARHPDPSPSPLDRTADALTLDALLDAIRRLPEPERAVLVLLVQGESYREIGEARQTSPSNAYRLASLARSRLALARGVE